MFEDLEAKGLARRTGEFRDGAPVFVITEAGEIWAQLQQLSPNRERIRILLNERLDGEPDDSMKAAFKRREVKH